MKNKLTTADIILMALFATMTVVATSLIRIPMPAAVGAPFIHFGNTLVLLSVLLLGFKKGALAGGMGLAIFDVLNGFAPEAPYFILESFVIGAVATFVFLLFKKEPTKVSQIVVVAISASIAKIIMSYFKAVVMMMIAGASLTPALIGASTSLTATIINTISTIIVTPLLYFPLKKLVDDFYRRTKQQVN